VARRVLKHPRLMPYHRLIVAVLLINAGVLGYHLDRGDWLIADGSALSALAALTLVNFAAAVLIRQQNVLNVLFGSDSPVAGRARGRCGCDGASRRCTTWEASTPAARSPERPGSARSPAS
jgi:hypothetical protein